MKSSHAIELWLEALESEGRSPVTLGNYRRVTAQLPSVVPDMGADGSRAIRTWFTEYREGRSPSTVRSTFATWRAFYSWSLREGLISESPMKAMRTPKASEPQRKVYDRPDLRILFDYLKAQKTPVGLRNHALCAVLLDCGLRSSELCRLTMGDVADGAVVVRNSKSGKPRMVPMGDRSARVVAQYIARGRPKLNPKTDHLFVNQFGGALNRWGIEKILQRLGTAIGIPLGAHRFRFTAITAWLREGVPMETVRRLAGHATYQMLLVYAQLDGEDLRRGQAKGSPLDRL